MRENDTIGQVVVQECNERWELDIKAHCFEDAPLCGFVFLLSVVLISITLVPVEVRYVLVKFHAFRGHDQTTRRPELLMRRHFLQSLVDMQPQCQSLSSIRELFANWRKQTVSRLRYLSGAGHSCGSAFHLLEVELHVGVDGVRVPGCLECRAFVVPGSAAVTVAGSWWEGVAAGG